jgi:hypothetical protein
MDVPGSAARHFVTHRVRDPRVARKQTPWDYSTVAEEEIKMGARRF